MELTDKDAARAKWRANRVAAARARGRGRGAPPSRRTAVPVDELASNADRFASDSSTDATPAASARANLAELLTALGPLDAAAAASDRAALPASLPPLPPSDDASTDTLFAIDAAGLDALLSALPGATVYADIPPGVLEAEEGGWEEVEGGAVESDDDDAVAVVPPPPPPPPPPAAAPASNLDDELDKLLAL